jgi:hypothetical protein
MDIFRFLPIDEYNAALGASSASASNPFATITDLGAYLPLAGGTQTGDIEMSNSSIVKGVLVDGLEFKPNVDVSDPAVQKDSGSSSVNEGRLSTIIPGSTMCYEMTGNKTFTYPIGSQIEVFGTTGGINDGVHTVTAVQSVGPFLTGSTEIQWAGISNDISVLTGAFISKYQAEGKRWKVGDDNFYMYSGPDIFSNIIKSENYLSLSGTYISINVGGFGGDASYNGTQSNFEIDNDQGFTTNINSNIDGAGWGAIAIIKNNIADYTDGRGPASAEALPISIGSNYAVYKQGIYNTAAIGAPDTIVKTANTAYVHGLGFNLGGTGEMRLVHTPNAADFTATLQAASGTIAYLSDITGGNTIYTADDSLLGDRIVDLNGNSLTFGGNETVAVSGTGKLQAGVWEAKTQSGIATMGYIGSSLTNYGFLQTSAGLTAINAATAQTIDFRINNSVKYQVVSNELRGNSSLGMKFSLYSEPGGINQHGIGFQGSLFQNIVALNSVDFTWGYGTSASLTRLMTLEGTGNLGVGITAPTARLHVKGDALSNSLVLERSIGTPWFTADDNAILTLVNPTNAQQNLILGTGVTKAGIEFNSGYATTSKIYDRNDGTHNKGLTFQSRDNIFEFIDSSGSTGTAQIRAGEFSKVRKITGDVVRPLVIQGGETFNDANDGIQMETLNNVAVQTQRFAIQTGAVNVNAWFNNIGGLGIGTNSGITSMATVNGDVETLGSSNGVIVLDRTNGLRYRIYTDNGVLHTEAA